MRALVLRAFGAPELGEFRDPAPSAAGGQVLEVLAAGINHLDRAKASGTFYGSVPEPPFVVGTDGVGRTAEGARVYFDECVAPFGSMAERVLAAGELLPVRDEVPDAVAAALGNSGMAALIALGFHGELAAGERVAIVGATGVAGRIALQVARARNADAIVGVGRRSPRLDALPARGATATVALDESDLGDAITRAAGGPVDVVVDFVGGSPGARAIAALGLHGRYVQVGSKAGATIEVPTALLRSRLLTLRGTAGFREPHDRRAAAYAELLDLAAAGRLAVDVTAIPLEDAAEAWRVPDGSADGKLVVLPPSIQ